MRLLTFWQQLPKDILFYTLSPTKALIHPLAFAAMASLIALLPLPGKCIHPSSPRGRLFQAWLRLVAIFVACASLLYPWAFLAHAISMTEQSIRLHYQEIVSLPDGFQVAFHLRKLLIFPPFVLLWRIAPLLARWVERKPLPSFVFIVRLLGILCAAIALYYGLQEILTHLIRGHWPEPSDGPAYPRVYVRGTFSQKTWSDYATIWFAGAISLWSLGEVVAIWPMRPRLRNDLSA